jgi:outer membrane protein assembly factor BamB
MLNTHLVKLCGLVALGCLCGQTAAAGDWPNWRGPAQNRISNEKNLPAKWSPKGENLLWSNPQLGSRSTPVVLGNRLYTICRDQPSTKLEGEKVVCADAATGKILWENKFNVYLSDVPDTRLGWSSCTVDPNTGKVYALGVCGLFQCIDGATGKTLWSHSLAEKFGLLSTYGGRTNVPVIVDDLVLISSIVIGWDKMAKPAHRFMAFDKSTGVIQWFNGTRISPYDTTYSTPTVATIGNQRALIFGSGDGAVWAFQPLTGRQIWKYQVSKRGLNVSPLVHNNRVFTGHSEENLGDNTMGSLVSIDATGKDDLSGTDKVLWKVKQKMVGKSSPLMIDGKLYAVEDSAGLMIIDPKTGKQLYRKKLGTVQRSTPLFADGKLYITTANGRVYTLAPDGDKVKILHKDRLPSGEECHGSPIAAHGRVYIPTSSNLYCIGDKEKIKDIEPLRIPERPLSVVSPQARASQIQLVPAEVLITSGSTQPFRVRKFDESGQRYPGGSIKAVFSIEGSGTIDAKTGIFTAPANAGHTHAIITAKVGDLTSQARIRMVPPLPWKFDFDDGNVPITWIGGRVRHIAIDGTDKDGGGKILQKRTEVPTRPGQTTKLGTRSRTWFGPDTLSNYTVQADFKGQDNAGKIPDGGLIAQRYTLSLMGAAQELHLISWVTHDKRTARRIPFAWKPEVWYRMKFSAAVEDGKAVLRGKVWPRDEKEPVVWTVEMTDERPNLTGSPGMFGNARDALLFIDNISVTPNS